MNLLPLVPPGLLIVVFFIDSILRRGKTGLVWVIASVILCRFYIDTPQMNQLANDRPAAAAGRLAAVSFAALVVYFIVTFKDKKVANCMKCGTKPILFGTLFAL